MEQPNEQELQCPCVYCGFQAYNVIEVRYARTLKHGTGVDEDQAPREILARGYYVCDGCMALLDWHVEHHLQPSRHSIYNAVSIVYFVFGLWAMLFLGSLAGQMLLLRERSFQAAGIVFAFLCLAAWFYRATVHSKYFQKWRRVREEPLEPANSLGGFTDLRDSVNKELNAYLPVRYEDSLRLAALPGSPPIRSVGPTGESWGSGPQTNFAGRGDNEWYRAIWVSWRLYPLTHVLVPQGVAWTPPPRPNVGEMQVACATLCSGMLGIVLAFLTTWSVALVAVASVLTFPLGWLLGTSARDFLHSRDLAKAGGAPG